jgi:hypothetical protein
VDWAQRRRQLESMAGIDGAMRICGAAEEVVQGMPSAASRLGGAGFDGEVMMRRRDYVAGGLGRSLHRRGQWR